MSYELEACTSPSSGVPLLLLQLASFCKNTLTAANIDFHSIEHEVS